MQLDQGKVSENMFKREGMATHRWRRAQIGPENTM